MITIKGHLLSSTATVKRFQNEKNLSPLEWQAPLYVRILQPHVVLQNRWGYKDGKKVWGYFYPFWYNTGMWQSATWRQQ